MSLGATGRSGKCSEEGYYDGSVFGLFLKWNFLDNIKNILLRFAFDLHWAVCVFLVSSGELKGCLVISFYTADISTYFNNSNRKKGMAWKTYQGQNAGNDARGICIFPAVKH